LGHVNSARSEIVVENSEPVESEHLQGPSWLLSERDRTILRQAIARAQKPGNRLQPVGFYRSHTRDGFDFDDQDNALLRDFFADKPSVCLLVKPSIKEPSAAQIGVREGESLVSLTQFPFHAGVLREGDFHIVSGAPAPVLALVPARAAWSAVEA